MMGQPTCETCRFFVEQIMSDIGEWEGQCRRYPPRINPAAAQLELDDWSSREPAPRDSPNVISGNVSWVYAFPIVDPEIDWCGEHQPRDTEGETPSEHQRN